MASRFVLLGLAQARSQWFSAVAQWANTGALPAEFVKCVSLAELRARLESGRAFSAVLLDGGLGGVDRDLIGAAHAAGCAALVVDDARVHRDWASLGADAVLLPVFDRHDLVEALERNASPISRHSVLPGAETVEHLVGPRAGVAMVCGSGGTGTSSVAAALAQGMAEAAERPPVLLADFSLRAEQAMLHDTRDIVPGVQELVEAHRSGRPSVEDARAMTYSIEARGYSLLLGLRRERDWASLRPHAFEAAVATLERAFGSVVCDADADLEGEVDGGSLDVEERNVMARTAAAHADAVFAVGLPGMKGTHSLVRVIANLAAFGVPPQRIVPVVNRGPRQPRARAEIAAAVAALLQPAGVDDIASPLFLPERRIEEAMRDGTRLPQQLVQPLVAAWRAVFARAGARHDPTPALRKVTPGSLGAWAGAGVSREAGA